MSKVNIKNLDSHSIITIDDRSYFLEFVMTKNKMFRIYKNKRQFFNPKFKEEKEKFIKNKEDFELVDKLSFKEQIDKKSEKYSGFKFSEYKPRKPIFVSVDNINKKYENDIKQIQEKFSNYCKLHKIEMKNTKIKLELPFEIGYRKNGSNEYEILVPEALFEELTDRNARELVNYVVKKMNKKDKEFEYTINYI